jgi:hypothetical protein
VPVRVPDDNRPNEGLDEDAPGRVSDDSESDEGPDSDELNEILDDRASVQAPDVGPSDDGLTSTGPTEQPGDQGEGGTEEQIVKGSERQTGEQRDGGFNEPEQKAFESLCSHLDPNPRRVKRLVNVYRLVRALINQRRVEAREGSDTALELPQSPYQILGWLILCEQWPYAAHVILDTLNPDSGLHMSDTVKTLYEKAEPNIDDRDLQKLDLNYDRLESFVDAHLVHLTLGDVQRLRPFTVNFNPALSAEVRLTLQSGEHSGKPEKGK